MRKVFNDFFIFHHESFIANRDLDERNSQIRIHYFLIYNKFRIFLGLKKRHCG